MLNLTTSATLTVAFVFGVAAFGAPVLHRRAATSGAHATHAVPLAVTSRPFNVEKHNNCVRTWLNQKPHVGSQTSFMAACVAKG